jgi:CRP-like cAMP-binding protein
MSEEVFNKFIDQYGKQLSPDTRSLIIDHMEMVEYPKKKVLVKAEERHPFAYYMLRGAARSFYLKDGIEVNTWFALEDEVIGSLRTFRDHPARETIELIEDSTLLQINVYQLKKVMPDHPEITNFILAIIEEYALFLEEKAYYTQMTDAMDKYQVLLENQPELLQRIPLTYLASFLGISRETLSRIRAK